MKIIFSFSSYGDCGDAGVFHAQQAPESDGSAAQRNSTHNEVFSLTEELSISYRGRSFNKLHAGVKLLHASIARTTTLLSSVVKEQRDDTYVIGSTKCACLVC
jgi:hypothetical protein